MNSLLLVKFLQPRMQQYPYFKSILCDESGKRVVWFKDFLSTFTDFLFQALRIIQFVGVCQ